ncbi:EF-hand domain-containing protein [Planctomicrobium piriforme]|uniref:Ca2+-binding protein, EF-hand superfamily n=1 Tax=Planctomicrobium piriforme TaxID=1576369 RepID=A0A1I3RQ34_9PLAN|nr:EF-hand domain-containing protein [Planctomicrobium piriforme]SFJ48425.1 Ca2+-binding protein, EF-hand superfamily [Planctomicrobium piriforme]
MLSRFSLCLLIGCLCALGSDANGQSPPSSSPRELFVQLDENQDGLLSKSELRKWRGSGDQLGQAPNRAGNLAAKLLPAFDDNGDEALSLAEFLSSPFGYPAVDWFAIRRDLDADGFLNLAEFAPPETLKETALAADIFQRLDRDHDGRLSPVEMEFQIEERRLTPSRLFALRDRNSDGLLTLGEAFSPIRSDLETQPRILIPRHAELFQIADSNADQQISQEEWQAEPGLYQAVTLEVLLARKQAPFFQQRDHDHNGLVSKSEWLDEQPENQRAVLSRDFVVCDFNRDGQLSFLEFACLPSLTAAYERPALVDPVVEHVEQRIAELRSALKSRDDAATVQAVGETAPRMWSWLTPEAVTNWDRDGSATLSQRELRRGIESLYGIRDEQGRSLRRHTGQVFDRRTCFYFDADKNGSLSRSEFLAKYWKRGAEADADFNAGDLDHDGNLQMNELEAGSLFWLDTQREFARFDVDLDGQLSSVELTKQAYPHEREVISQLLPAFDTDADDRLSFREFRLTPLANPVLDYNRQYWDADQDGRLTLREYHPSVDASFLALSELFFGRLDRDHNGSLELSEMTFRSTPKSLAPDEQFAKLDANGDRQLTVDELLAWHGLLPPQALRQRLVVFDLNQDRQLNLDEFRTVPGFVSIEQRAALELMKLTKTQAQVESVLSRLPVPVNNKDITTKWSGKLPVGIPLEAALWDRNQNQQIDVDEARLGLETAYGLRRGDGAIARWANGTAFNDSFFVSLDRDDDELIERKEFVAEYKGGSRPAGELFDLADQNHDDRLSRAEADAAELFRSDLPNQFLKLDQNGDSVLSIQELQQAPSWQQPLATRLLPGFDQNQDGGLSLGEYLDSPFGHPLFNWFTPRVDRNGDGFLDLAEFTPNGTLTCTALAGEFFRKLDQNHDERLSLHEVDMTVDEQRLPPHRLIGLRDRNGDGLLSVIELYSALGKELPEQSQVLVPRHQRLFEESDKNGDRLLSVAELESQPELIAVAELEGTLRNRVWPSFLRRDRDQDGHLDLVEWLAGQPETALAAFQQEFGICDFDRNGNLSFIEFACMPSLWPLQQRPMVVDPIENEVQSLLNLAQNADTQSAGLTPARLLKLTALELGDLNELDLLAWDDDKDGLLQTGEIRSHLEVLYGLKMPSGSRLRRANGQVFDARTFRYADTNHDNRLVKGEFLARYWKTGSEADADFARTDINGDGELSLAELLTGEPFWIETQSEFRRFDQNQDALLTAEELHRHARRHERQTVQWIFPAFDLNRDGSLTFSEFRSTPLANPLQDDNIARWDLDHNGSLSRQEFETAKAPLHRGLSQMFFRRLDANRDQALTMDEFRFEINPRRARPDVLFDRLDANNDGILALEELLERERPTDNRDWAKRKFERRSLNLTDAFARTDSDRNQQINRDEFLAVGTPLQSVARGTPETAPDLRAAGVSKSGTIGINWRLTSFVCANLVIAVGLGWWYFRR